MCPRVYTFVFGGGGGANLTWSHTTHTVHNREMQHTPAPQITCTQVGTSLDQRLRTRHAPLMSSVHQRRYPVNVRLDCEVAREGVGIAECVGVMHGLHRDWRVGQVLVHKLLKFTSRSLRKFRNFGFKNLSNPQLVVIV